MPKHINEEEVVVKKEVNLDEKVVVRSIAPWLTGVARIESNGDISIPPLGTARLTRNEIISQVNNGNTLFTGTDGRGSHATWYIEDEYTRREVEFESTDGSTKQQILTKESVKDLFDEKTMNSFKKRLENEVITRAEKFAIVEAIQDKSLKINDYERIMLAKEMLDLKL